MKSHYPRLAFAFLDEETQKDIAWRNAAPNPFCDECIDCDGRLIRKDEYGKQTAHGWEKDHAVPKGIGGPDVAWNVRARHWQGNRRAGGQLASALRDIAAPNRLMPPREQAAPPVNRLLSGRLGLGTIDWSRT